MEPAETTDRRELHESGVSRGTPRVRKIPKHLNEYLMPINSYDKSVRFHHTNRCDENLTLHDRVDFLLQDKMSDELFDIPTNNLQALVYSYANMDFSDMSDIDEDLLLGDDKSSSPGDNSSAQSSGSTTSCDTCSSTSGSSDNSSSDSEEDKEKKEDSLPALDLHPEEDEMTVSDIDINDEPREDGEVTDCPVVFGENRGAHHGANPPVTQKNPSGKPGNREVY